MSSRLQTGQLKQLRVDSCHIHEIFYFKVFRLAVGALSKVKPPGHEVDHSHPSSAQVQNAWSDISTPLCAFMRWCFINHRDSFTLALLIMYPTVHTILLYVDRWTDSCMMKVIGTYLYFVMNVLITGCTVYAEWACAVLW